MSEIIKTGKVVGINKEGLDVEILSCSACSSCAIKSACGLSEVKKRIIKVCIDNPELYHINDNVEVSLSAILGLKAIWYAFGLPLVILLATVFIAFACGFGEIMSGICGIIILIPYYFALFLNKNRLEQQFSCSLKNNKSKD